MLITPQNIKEYTINSFNDSIYEENSSLLKILDCLKKKIH